jgi:hypothetical protein
MIKCAESYRQRRRHTELSGHRCWKYEDVSIGESETAKLRLEAEGLFIKVYKIRLKMYDKLLQEIHISQLFNQTYTH